MIPLENIGTINPVIMTENPPEKYIQIVTIDGHDFWFMGFVNFEKALHHLLGSVSDFRAAQAVLDGRWLHSLLDPLSSSKFWCSVCYCFLFAWMYKRQQFVCFSFVIQICPFHLVFLYVCLCIYCLFQTIHFIHAFVPGCIFLFYCLIVGDLDFFCMQIPIQ